MMKMKCVSMNGISKMKFSMQFFEEKNKIEEIIEPNKRNAMETKPLKITCSKKNMEGSL